MKKDPLWNERKAEQMLSKRWQDKQNDIYLARGREKFAPFMQQQQEARGFPQYGAIQIPATVTWLSQAYDNLATYPAGNGSIPVAGSFVQIPGLSASTPGTPPPGGVWVIQPPALGGNGWQVNPNTRFSSWAQNFLTFQWPPNYVEQIDCAWWPGDSQVCSTTANQYYIPAPGRMLITSAASTTFSTIQVNIAGAWTTVFTFTPTTCQWMECDGMTWRVNNSGTTRNTYTMYRIKQAMDYP
jgi:hypothetical protein